MGNEEIMQEAQELTESALETVERTLDSMEEATAVVKNNPYIIAGAAVIGLGLGFAIGYKVAYKKLELKFDDLLTEEVQKTKDFYAAFHKKDEFATPESAADVLVPAEKRTATKAPAHTRTATEAIKLYTGQDVNVVGANNPLSAPDDVDQEIDIVVEETVVSTNVFFNGNEVTPDYDPEAMLSNRDRTQPYVITKNEFFENILDSEVSSLTWYAGDKTLVPDDDEMNPIQDEVAIVGDALGLFGMGSEDSQVVYVRNEQKGSVYEIVRSKGSYASEVLDLGPDEEEIDRASSYTGGGRKFRHGDD